MSDFDQSYSDILDVDSVRYYEAKRWSIVLTVLGVAVAVWVGLFAQPYQLAVWTAMAFPVLPLLLAQKYDGILKFAVDKRDPALSVSTAFVMPIVGLCGRAVQDWNVVDWGNFWIPFGIASVSVAAASIMIAPQIRRESGSWFVCIIFCAAYGYGAVLDVNGMLATAPSRRYHASIEDKYSTRGRRSTSYYLVLSAWGPRGNGNKVNVSWSEYSEHDINDPVIVTVRTGYLGIPCFNVR